MQQRWDAQAPLLATSQDVARAKDQIVRWIAATGAVLTLASAAVVYWAV